MKHNIKTKFNMYDFVHNAQYTSSYGTVDVRSHSLVEKVGWIFPDYCFESGVVPFTLANCLTTDGPQYRASFELNLLKK